MKRQQLLSKLEKQGFSEKIIQAFRKVRREDFIPEVLKEFAYEDIALPLFNDSTLSQPTTIAFILELLELKGHEKILEIGSGSGYVLELLSHLTKGEIYGLEVITELAETSQKLLYNNNIQVYNLDGSKGLQEKAPFDRILISASSTKVPDHLYSQLKNNGILVAPVINSICQMIKKNQTIILKEYPGFIFVELKS